jgi:hypothetical protein
VKDSGKNSGKGSVRDLNNKDKCSIVSDDRDSISVNSKNPASLGDNLHLPSINFNGTHSSSQLQKQNRLNQLNSKMVNSNSNANIKLVTGGGFKSKLSGTIKLPRSQTAFNSTKNLRDPRIHDGQQFQAIPGQQPKIMHTNVPYKPQSSNINTRGKMPDSTGDTPKQPLSVTNIPNGPGKAKKDFQRGLYEDSKKKQSKDAENETSLGGPECINKFGDLENLKQVELEVNGEEPIDFNGTLGRELQPAEFCSVKKGAKKFKETFDGRQLECEINGKRKKLNLPKSTRKIANETCPANDQHSIIGKAPRKKNLRQIQSDAGSIIDQAKFQSEAEERFFSPGTIPGVDSPEKSTQNESSKLFNLEHTGSSETTKMVSTGESPKLFDWERTGGTNKMISTNETPKLFGGTGTIEGPSSTEPRLVKAMSDIIDQGDPFLDFERSNSQKVQTGNLDQMVGARGFDVKNTRDQNFYHELTNNTLTGTMG